ncbi:MAG: Crp/Fnr family transcriptional regulator [Pseudomonadota bacterium]|nr:Crp/Fnr family transcriptional regulator [Pseudomonadota bacterium]
MNVKTDFGIFLQNIPTFADFGPAELAVLEQAMTVAGYPDGHMFLSEEKPGESMYLIVAGEVIATHRRANQRGLDVYERLGPGDVFGLIALIDHQRGWATYKAVGEVTAASLPASAFELLFSANAPIAHHFQSLIALQLVRDLRACADFLTKEFGVCVKT